MEAIGEFPELADLFGNAPGQPRADDLTGNRATQSGPPTAKDDGHESDSDDDDDDEDDGPGTVASRINNGDLSR